ncbi:MAG: ABC transporter permease [Armatimonadota bacterium]|nr:ABC transporter permease [Armatimonadota bacterium]MDR7532914.1 ABC transporter permease [Armatimonadota bacterium]MDR7536121.1 ABC transporter permease [Armatimonadota bacterium]
MSNGALAREPSAGGLAAAGRAVLAVLADTGRAAGMLVQAFRWVRRGHLELGETIVQLKRIGWDSIFIVLVTGLFAGMVLAYQTAGVFRKFGAQGFVGGLVGVSLAREAGPVFTAMVTAGRVGAGIAAELGTMTVTEQVDALRVLATDPVRFLVVPRLLAAAVALPVLTMFAEVVGAVGGSFVAVAAGVPAGSFWASLRQFTWTWDLYAGLLKAVFFGLIIAAVGAYRGLHASGGAEGVGRAATGAVVSAIVLIMAVNYFLNQLLFQVR